MEQKRKEEEACEARQQSSVPFPPFSYPPLPSSSFFFLFSISLYVYFLDTRRLAFLSDPLFLL
jgi:hypothetical protein